MRAISGFLLLVFVVRLCAEEPIEPKFILKDPIVKPDDEDAVKAYRIGTAMLQEDRALEASKYLLRAIELEPTFVDAIDHLGVAYRKLNMYDKAEEVYKQSIKINPENVVPRLNLALLYQLSGRLNESIQAYEEVSRLAPDDPEPYYGIGSVYQSQSDYNRSITYFDAAIARYAATKSDLIYDAYMNQAENHYQLKSYEKTLEFCKEINRRYPIEPYCLDRIKELEAR
ncbi:MAG: tetratricopeptide repeat protein [Helicobacteraceae bacterium]|nr:tetratricopeptide repeat protein [Helicobacteraceae bacterium]